MAKYGSGLSAVKLGAIEADGTMSTALVAVGNTVQGSMQFTSEEGTTTDFSIEEQDKPVKSIITPGATRVNWECYDISGENMVKLFGGTYDSTTRIYKAPTKVVAQEMSVQLISAEGHKLNIVRASVFPSFNWAFTKDGMGKIAIAASVLAPDDVSIDPFTIEYAA